MKKITFNYTHNVFLDNGIVGVYKFLKEFNNKIEDRKELKHLEVEENVHFQLFDDRLDVEHEHLFELLEELYYVMGREVYDTSTIKQEENGGENLYFNQDGTLKDRFPKMNTYGFTELLTNNAQGVARKEENSLKIAEIEKKTPELAIKIKQVYEEQGAKMLSKIFFEEPYTKITRLEKPIPAYFEDGLNNCFLTGKSYKKLVDAQNISPFLSGLTYFDSFMSNSSRKVSWLALYLSRFSAGLCLYSYANKLRESLNVYFLHTDSLLELDRIHRKKFLSKVVKLADTTKNDEYLANFPRSEKTALGKAFDYINTHEVLLYLLYNIYVSVLDSNSSQDFFKNLQEEGEEFRPISITAIRAESFAATMRPVQFEVVTHFYRIMQMFAELEKNNIKIGEVMSSLKLLKPSRNSPNNSKRFEQERQLRELILRKIFSSKSITDEIETFCWDCYSFTLDDPQRGIGFKQYRHIYEFYNFYENHISQMNDLTNLRAMALSLGAQIGQGILNYSTNDKEEDVRETLKKDNAKRGRKYIIRLKKANQFADFLAQIAELQARYTLGIKKEFLETLPEENFPVIKQFIIISILNQINPVINPRNKENNEAK